MNDRADNGPETDKNPKISKEKRRRDIEDRADAALAAMEDLAEILDEETEAVRDRNDKVFKALQEEKLEAVEEYKRAMTEFEVRQADLVLLDDDTRLALRQTHQELERIFADNLATLDVARQATGRVISIIIEAARRAVLQTDRYDDEGALEPGSRGGPVGYDETL